MPVTLTLLGLLYVAVAKLGDRVGRAEQARRDAARSAEPAQPAAG